MTKPFNLYNNEPPIFHAIVARNRSEVLRYILDNNDLAVSTFNTYAVSMLDIRLGLLDVAILAEAYDIVDILLRCRVILRTLKTNSKAISCAFFVGELSVINRLLGYQEVCDRIASDVIPIIVAANSDNNTVKSYITNYFKSRAVKLKRNILAEAVRLCKTDDITILKNSAELLAGDKKLLSYSKEAIKVAAKEDKLEAFKYLQAIQECAGNKLTDIALARYAVVGMGTRVLKYILTFPEIANNLDANNNLILQLAAGYDKPEAVKELLKFNNVVNNIAVQKNLPFHSAFSSNNPELIALFLQYKAVRDLAHVHNNFALKNAVKLGSLKLVTLLLEIPTVRARIHADDNKALEIAILCGHYQIFKHLLIYNLVKDNVCANPYNVLNAVAQVGDCNMLMDLIRLPKVADAVAHNNNLPLKIAINNNHQAMALLLFKLPAVEREIALDSLRLAKRKLSQNLQDDNQIQDMPLLLLAQKTRDLETMCLVLTCSSSGLFFSSLSTEDQVFIKSYLEIAQREKAQFILPLLRNNYLFFVTSEKDIITTLSAKDLRNLYKSKALNIKLNVKTADDEVARIKSLIKNTFFRKVNALINRIIATRVEERLALFQEACTWIEHYMEIDHVDARKLNHQICMLLGNSYAATNQNEHAFETFIALLEDGNDDHDRAMHAALDCSLILCQDKNKADAINRLYKLLSYYDINKFMQNIDPATGYSMLLMIKYHIGILFGMQYTAIKTDDALKFLMDLRWSMHDKQLLLDKYVNVFTNVRTLENSYYLSQYKQLALDKKKQNKMTLNQRCMLHQFNSWRINSQRLEGEPIAEAHTRKLLKFQP